MINIIFFGPPGAGKGTQAKQISKYLNLPHLSTGDILRNKVSQKDSLALKLKEVMSSGKLVSDDILNQIVSERLLSESEKGFILDGFPRTKIQAEGLDNLLSKQSRAINFVIKIEVNEDTIIDRIVGRFSCDNCGTNYHDSLNQPKKKGVCDICSGTKFVRRKDDKLDVIKNRFITYNRDTGPLTPYYEDKGLLYNINGMQDIDKVFEQIKKVVLS